MKKFSVLILAALVLLTFIVKPTSLDSDCKCLDEVKVLGSDLVDENSTTQYTAKAYFTDGTSQYVTVQATWNLQSAVFSSLTQSGVLTVGDVDETGTCRVSAAYTYNGVTKSGYKDVTVLGSGQWPPM